MLEGVISELERPVGGSPPDWKQVGWSRKKEEGKMGIECGDNSFLGLVGRNLKSIIVRQTKVVGTAVGVCQVSWVMACSFDGPLYLPTS